MAKLEIKPLIRQEAGGKKPDTPPTEPAKKPTDSKSRRREQKLVRLEEEVRKMMIKSDYVKFE